MCGIFISGCTISVDLNDIVREDGMGCIEVIAGGGPFGICDAIDIKVDPAGCIECGANGIGLLLDPNPVEIVEGVCVVLVCGENGLTLEVVPCGG